MGLRHFAGIWPQAQPPDRREALATGVADLTLEKREVRCELGKTLAPKSAHFGGVRAPALHAPPNGPGFDNGILRKANESGAFRVSQLGGTVKS